jgi:uncharacterized membrane protein
VKVGASRLLAQASYLGLVLWLMLWITSLGEVRGEHVSLLLLFGVGPLLLPLPGVLAARDRPLVLGALLSLAYLLHGAMVAWTGEGQTWLGLIEAGLALIYLVSASLFVRWRAQSMATA